MAIRPVMELTEPAAARVRKLVENSQGQAIGLRVGVKNGGCAGMSYTVELAAGAEAGDTLVEAHGAKVFIDSKALLFLIGSVMDFQTTKMAATFSFANPNETASCGCGESVALTPVSEEKLQEFSV